MGGGSCGRAGRLGRRHCRRHRHVRGSGGGQWAAPAGWSWCLWSVASSSPEVAAVQRQYVGTFRGPGVSPRGWAAEEADCSVADKSNAAISHMCIWPPRGDTTPHVNPEFTETWWRSRMRDCSPPRCRGQSHQAWAVAIWTECCPALVARGIPIGTLFQPHTQEPRHKILLHVSPM